MLAQRRRWPSLATASYYHVVFAGGQVSGFTKPHVTYIDCYVFQILCSDSGPALSSSHARLAAPVLADRDVSFCDLGVASLAWEDDPSEIPVNF